MIRIVVENVFYFLLPTLLYITWYAFSENKWPGLWRVLRDAPLVKLFVSGAVLMLVTLVLFSQRDGHDPSEVYVPPGYKDGKLTPGHVEKAPAPSPTPPK